MQERILAVSGAYISSHPFHSENFLCFFLQMSEGWGLVWSLDRAHPALSNGPSRHTHPHNTWGQTKGRALWGGPHSYCLRCTGAALSLPSVLPPLVSPAEGWCFFFKGAELCLHVGIQPIQLEPRQSWLREERRSMWSKCGSFCHRCHCYLDPAGWVPAAGCLCLFIVCCSSLASLRATK